MAKKQLTWCASGGRQRWRKMYRGTLHYFPVEPGESKLDSYRRCVTLWESLKVDLDKQVEPLRPDYAKAIANRQAMLDWWNANPAEPVAAWELKVLRSEIARLDTEGRKPDPPRLDLHAENPIALLSQEAQRLWHERLTKPKPQQVVAGTIGDLTNRFLDHKRASAASGQLSMYRYGSLRSHLGIFETWVSRDKTVKSLDALCLLDWRSHLISLSTKKSISTTTAWDRMQAVRQLIKFGWELGLIDLPRNIASKELRIAHHSGSVQAMKPGEWMKCFEASTDRTKLYWLLMANCGMTATDMAELKPDEVDWKEGRIVRKRSKTRQVENVPTVDYKLWPETLRLLKQERSPSTERVLLNANEQPLRVLWQRENGQLVSGDSVWRACTYAMTKATVKNRHPKDVRKMGATLLSNSEHEKHVGMYLGHAGRSVAARHYVETSKPDFDKAIDWLGRQLNQGR
ncbi:MAG: site-specific integrase [Planctomycetota bacterium]|nr:site-specific integrase [Planctomycetota bacterium]